MRAKEDLPPHQPPGPSGQTRHQLPSPSSTEAARPEMVASPGGPPSPRSRALEMRQTRPLQVRAVSTLWLPPCWDAVLWGTSRHTARTPKQPGGESTWPATEASSRQPCESPMLEVDPRAWPGHRGTSLTATTGEAPSQSGSAKPLPHSGGTEPGSNQGLVLWKPLNWGMICYFCYRQPGGTIWSLPMERWNSWLGRLGLPVRDGQGRPLHPTPILLQNTLNTNPDPPIQDLLSSSTQTACLWPWWWSL